MPKTFKPGFTYIYSETLKQEIAYKQSTGQVYCSDGTVYLPEEIEVIKRTYGELPLQVHLLKKKFGGVILNDKGRNTDKPAESRQSENRTDCKNTSKTVQKDAGNMQETEPGLLDIY